MHRHIHRFLYIKYYRSPSCVLSLSLSHPPYLSVTVWIWQFVGGNMYINIAWGIHSLWKAISLHDNKSNTRRNIRKESEDENSKSWWITAIRDCFLNLLMVCFSRLIVIRYHMFSSTPAALVHASFRLRLLGQRLRLLWAAFGFLTRIVTVTLDLTEFLR